ncbi:MAG: hypothetical protein HRT64_00210 [Erythrobacter sp.]|nr:hypothetical protein [Erythrobacter sp.]
MNLSQQSDRALAEARRVLVDNQNGGRHRRARSIGQGSAKEKAKVWVSRAKYFVGALVTIFVTASLAGLILDGIGFTGVMMTALAVMAAAYVFSNYPKQKTFKRTELKQGSPKEMVAKTERWLEQQLPALPAPAVQVVDQLGTQLDALAVQLETVDAAHPAMNDVRELVGEYIPETIDNYRKIPEHLRKEEHTGKTADERLTDSLTKVSSEIDRVTRQLAEGAMDDLAIKDRYLEYRFGGIEALSEESKG